MKRDKGRVSDDWVRFNFNLDDERKFTKDYNCVATLEDLLHIKKDELIPRPEFLLMVARAIGRFDKVKFSYGGEYLLYENVNRPETDEEVLDRLKAVEIKKRKEDAFERKEFAEYKRLVKKFGMVNYES